MYETNTEQWAEILEVTLRQCSRFPYPFLNTWTNEVCIRKTSFKAA